MTTETPLALFPWNWLEELDPVFLDLEGIPLSSIPKGFSLDIFQKKLSEKLKIQATVEVLDPLPLESSKAKEKGLIFSVPGMPGTLAFTMPRAEIEELLFFLLEGKKDGTISDEYVEPFWNFFVDILKSSFQESFQGEQALSLQQVGEGQLPHPPALLFPLKASFNGKTFSASLVVGEAFLKEWRKSHLKSVHAGKVAALLKERIEIPVDVVVGGIELPKSDWKKIEEGDTLLLDHLTYSPGAEKGEALLFFGEHPLFRIKAKTGAVKIIEPAKGVKIFMPLEPEQPVEKEKEDDIGAVPEEMPTLTEEDRGAPVSLHDLPLQIRIEMGRFKLPLNQVLELQEGNILKLDVDPRKGVDLVVEGKVIGRGELVKIGDLVGVRITDLQ